MTSRGITLVKRTLSRVDSGKGGAASELPLFSVPELDEARKLRTELMHKLAHTAMDARSRIRTEQKLALIVAKIMRLEMQLGRQH